MQECVWRRKHKACSKHIVNACPDVKPVGSYHSGRKCKVCRRDRRPRQLYLVHSTINAMTAKLRLDRAPKAKHVKITISVSAELKEILDRYAHPHRPARTRSSSARMRSPLRAHQNPGSIYRARQNIMAIRVLPPKVIPIPEQPHFRGDDAMATPFGHAIPHDVQTICPIPFIYDVPTDSFL